MIDKESIFRCRCGHYGFLVVEYLDDEYKEELFFTFIDEPKGLWQRLKSFFASKRYINEVILNKKDVRKLSKQLDKFLKS